MPGKPEPRTALLTGATSGIGHATMLDLLGRGWRVVGVGRRIERLHDAGNRFPGRLHAVAADLSEPGASAKVMSQVPDGWAVDTLIHAAGHDAGGSTAFHACGGVDRSMKLAVNLVCLADLARTFLPGWLERGRGDLVAVGSIVGREAVPGLTDYTMTKHGLHGLLAGLRMDYADTGLRFIEVVPGVVRSEFALNRWHGDEARSERFYAAFKDCLLPEDVAAAIVWALDQPGYVAVDEIVLRPTRR